MNEPNLSEPSAGACCPSCDTSASNRSDTALEIVCTLGAGDFKQRVADIRDLAARSLLRSERRGLTLNLTYERDALAKVKNIVAQEADCCRFLDFTITHEGSEVHLTITAPEAAAEAAEELFAHFAPELARQVL